MNRKLSLVAIGLVLLSITSCMQNPKGEKAETTDTYAISTKTNGVKLDVNTGSSKIEWLGTKPTGTHWGTVNLSDGIVFIDNNLVTGGKFTIDLNSIAVLDIEDPDMNGRLLGHLKSSDFFHVDTFPVAVFEIASVESFTDTTQSNNEIIPNSLVKGNLTMRGITKGISFPAFIEVNDNTVNVKTPQFLINRTLWSVNYGSKSIFAELKDNFIHDEMGIKITLVADKD